MTLLGAKASQQWYDEIKDYKWSKPEFSMETGHFTQVVWKNSTQVGFAVAQAPNGYFYAVANYYPAGNYTGQFPKNVLQPSEDNIGMTFETELKKPKVEMTSSEAQSLFIAEALAAHNDYRDRHGVEPLEHNRELSDIAQNWANNIADRDTMQHSSNKYNDDHLGENLAMWYSTGADHYDGKLKPCP